MTHDSDPRTLRRADLRHVLSIPVRFNDNDPLGHVNNVVYHRYVDLLVVDFVTRVLAVDWLTAPVYPLAAESLCRFHRPLSFPQTVEAGLRVQRLGTTSVTFQVALFAADAEAPAATGHFVHIYVARDTERPTPIPPEIRERLEAHM